MARSVLRVADQLADRFPDRCVLSGVATDRAVRVTAVQWSGRRWLLGVAGLVPLLGALPGRTRMRVSLPVSPGVWSTWNRRNTASLVALLFALGFTAAGAVRWNGGLIGLGFVLLLVAMAYRTRAHHNFWTTCTIDASGSLIIIEPAHREFDEQAQWLFMRSISS